MELYIVGTIAVFAGGFVQGCTGFGYAMIVTPPLLVFVEPRLAVPVIAVLALGNSGYVAVHCRHHVRRTIVLPLVAGGLLGLPIGIYFLSRIDAEAMKFAIGTLMLLVAAMMLTGWSAPMRRQAVALPFVGTLSGFLSGSTGLGGPPIVLFLTSQETKKEVFRGNIVAYFTIQGTVGVFAYAYTGLLTSEAFWLTLVFAPTMVVGSYLGIRMGDRISEKGFRRIAIVVAGGMGLALALTNANALF